MSTDKVIFVGEQWGATGSDVTGRDAVRNRKYVMENDVISCSQLPVKRPH
jgi:hypothetical protein